MNGQPRKSVSVILVSYYNNRDLENCLPALFDALDPTVEVILVDNASGDVELDKVVTSFPRVRLIRSQENRGFGSACNLAAQMCRSEVLVFLNPDTIPEPGWLSRLLRALDAQPAPGLVTPKILLLSEPGRINTCGNTIHLTGITLCRGVRAPQTEFAVPDSVGAVSGACFATRRSLFVELGGFDEDFFLYMEDTDLSLRARLRGCDIAFVPDAVVRHDYALTFSPNKIFLQERNRYIMLLKTLKWSTLVLLIPALLVAEIITWGFVLLREWTGVHQKLSAYRWTIAHWPQIIEKRRQVQLQRRVADKQLVRALVSHLDIRQLGDTVLARGLELFFDAFFAPYYWCLQWLITW